MGDNPYVRMTKAEYDKECKVCTRPFTVFRWRAGTKGRFKKTEICQTCAKLKNVCQTCLLDLAFNLPVQVRDSALPDGTLAEIPLSDANREYFSRIADKQVSQGMLPYGRAQYSPLVQRLARNQPYYERNRAHICSFFVKGSCNRGAACPFRHEKPEEQGDLANQNIKDRYYGVNDPVAKKLLKRVQNKDVLAPDDTDIKTIYVGNCDKRITEQDLKDHFYYFGEIKSIKLVPAQHCAFVEFTTRDACEAAVQKLFNRLIVNGVFLKIAWAKPQQLINEQLSSSPPSQSGGNFYPSMDPERMGSIPQGEVAPLPGTAPPPTQPKWAAPANTEKDNQPPPQPQPQLQ
uniref:Pre-mRNA-splicing factor RBM22 n=1 Tax=Arcella intermedia TaxID=1963864 RepID=A0A6B2L7P4_9EUKA